LSIAYLAATGEDQAMKHKQPILIAYLLAMALCAPVAVSAVTKKPASSSPKASASPSAKPTPSPTATPVVKPRALPFYGTISSVDQEAKTFTVAGKKKSRVFKITDRSVLSKAGAAATMQEIVANEEVRGSYWKAADGSLEAKKVELGPKSEVEKAAASTRSQKKTAQPEGSAAPSTSPAPPPAPTASPKP
jgi:hypothetical protein